MLSTTNYPLFVTLKQKFKLQHRSISRTDSRSNQFHAKNTDNSLFFLKKTSCCLRNEINGESQELLKKKKKRRKVPGKPE